MSSPHKSSGIRKLSFLSFNRNSDSNDGGTGGNPTEVRLDDEMEKVFFTSGTPSEERFDVAKLHDVHELPATPRHFGEHDYSLHRKKSYPHIHVPLKALHSRSMRRRLTSPQISDPLPEASTAVDSASASEDVEAAAEDALSRVTTESASDGARGGHPDEAPDADEDEDTGALSSGSEAPLSDPAAVAGQQQGDSPLFGSPDRRVQFTVGAIPNIPEDEAQHNIDGVLSDAAAAHEKDKKHRKNRYHHGHHARFRKYSLQEDPGWRKRSGSERDSQGGAGSGRSHGRRVSIQPEDATLQEADIDDLDSHRSDEPRVVRRHKGSRSGSFVHIGRKDGGEKLLQNVLLPHTFKKMYDHSPHAVFVQLDELYGLGEEREWKETARWIKYEEDVEEGSDRWGRPHVASLSFHSLLNLRRCLETGVVLLDLEERDLPGVAYRVSEQMVVDELIQESDKPQIMRALLLRHRHVNEHERGFRFVKRQNSSYASLQSLWLEDGGVDYGQRFFGRSSICSAPPLRGSPHFLQRFPHNLNDGEKRKTSVPLDSLAKNGVSTCDSDGRLIVPSDNHAVIDMKEEMYISSTEDLKKVHNDTILKRIPIGAEATTVLVGAVDFLEQPTIAFVRLAEGVLMPSITEVTIPVRFLFILLGPITADLDYHEIGRSISTLMANHQFHKIAYKADDRKALLSAINEFLDDSIVLPPGDWEKQTLLQFDELKAKSDAIRNRKLKAMHAKEGPGDDANKALLTATGGDGKKPRFPDPLKRTRRPFGGLINDLRRRYPFYKSDVLEGLNAQCAAAALFMYFAALSGAITFGGLMSDKTQNLIGISETLLATSIAGVVFALLSGQPLIIVGSTGPLLLFDESLFEFCKSNNVEYLTTRIYIGIWLGIIALFVACFEGSVFVKLFTRFTEEIFSALISLLYIVESFMKLFFVFGRHPLLANYCNIFLSSILYPNNTSNELYENNTNTNMLVDLNDSMLMDEGYNNSVPIETTSDNFTERPILNEQFSGPINQPNTALFCTILSLGTFAIAYYLRLFRNSKFLGRSARRALGDFGVPIAIVLMVTLDYFVPETYTEKLRVPEGLSPSNPAVRGWLIHPGGTEQPMQIWLMFAAAIPAMLVYILVFMETHIAELIIDKKERKLRKGSGFHLDIVLVCLMNVGCGFMGAPWICAATVRSVAHVSAVTVMSRTHAPGEKPHLVEVKEQRVSALTVAVLVGISVLMSPLLRLVPMSVLFGVFLYMGISSMEGIQFFDRVKLFFMPVKHHPSTSYVKRVQTVKMHLFTFIQLMCLVILWIVKSTRASLAFPFFLLLMVPLRAQMTHLFTAAELRALDGDQPDADDDEPDFYAEAPLPG